MKAMGKNANYMTVPAAIRELSKIEIVRQADGVYRQSYAVTATQKEILQAFNLTAADVKKQAVELGSYLRRMTA
jgi:predicted transcriptional regulator